VNSGGGGLAYTPMIDVRGYVEPTPDIHDRFRSFSTRARLTAANGHANNQVILITPGPNGITGPVAGAMTEAMRLMDQ